MFVKSFVFSAALALSVLASGAQAAVITFETAVPDFEASAPGSYFFGPTSEAGFDYSVESGALFLDTRGNPGQDMEGNPAYGGGVLKIVASDGSLFQFGGLDYAAYSSEPSGNLVLRVTGFRLDTQVGFTDFSLASASNGDDGAYNNWMSFTGGDLAGLDLDTLLISLNATESDAAVPEFLAVDNIQLTSAVPEPATWAMMIAGFGLAGAALRRRRLAAFA